MNKDSVKAGEADFEIRRNECFGLKNGI